MLVRIKFSKEGALKFIGHLDTMRYFQKAFFRSGLPLRYTEGFNPHPIMEFANPLGVGLTSNGEYLDFELTKDYTVEDIAAALEKALTDGFNLEKVSILEDRIPGKKKASAMSLVNRADYLLYLPGGLDKSTKETATAAFESYLSKDKLPVTVKTKTAEKEIDLKEFIYAEATSFEDFKAKLPDDEYTAALKSSIEEKEDGLYFYLRLSSGSVNNIKPEVFLEDLIEKENLNLKADDFIQHRIEMFHLTDTGVVPLWAVK